MYVNPAWPTRDNVIPWGVFYVIYSRMSNVLALDRLNAGNAHAYAIALTHSDDKAATERMTDELVREAIPEDG